MGNKMDKVIFPTSDYIEINPPTKSLCGSIASFSDGGNAPIPSLKVAIEPVQDLHGYDAPWAGGAGKNKFKTDFKNTTINGTTITKTSDGRVLTSGVPTSAFDFVIGHVSLPAGSYILNGCPANGGADKYKLQVTDYPVVHNLGLDYGRGASFTLEHDMEIAVRIQIYTGASATLDYKPMIRLASVTDATFAPYSNICPISGWDEAVVTRCGKNLYPHNGISIYDYAFSQQIAFSQMRNPIFMKGGQKYVLSLSENITLFRMRAFDNFQNLVTDASIVNALNQGSGTGLVFYANGNFFGYNGAGANSITTFQPTEDIWFDMTVQTTSPSQVMFEIGDTPTNYEPYAGNTYTIDLDGTHYGGEVDVVNGIFTPAPYYASYNGETLTGEWISDRDKYEVGATPTIGAQVVNIGASGTPVSILPTAIKSLKGVNNVYANTGDVCVTYVTQEYQDLAVNFAATASKLGSSNVGSATQPIYLNGGTATACTYTLGKSVPSDAVFTDTNTNVTQTESTTNSNYEILLSGTASTATTTEGSLKSSCLRFNPSKKAIMEGIATTASGNNSHAEGQATYASTTCAHAEGVATSATGQYSHAEGATCIASGTYSHAEGSSSRATYDCAHAEGMGTTSSGGCSHAEGGYTLASNGQAHAEGYKTTANGGYSHAEGTLTLSSGNASHAEGFRTTASGSSSHAEGSSTSASGQYSHAEGSGTKASGHGAHAEGLGTTASGVGSHAEGSAIIANHRSQHAFGEYNLTDASTAAATARGDYVEIVGNGLSSTQLSNARTLDWDGNEWLAGSLVASSVSAVDSNSNTNTSISPTGLATYTVPSGSQAISTGLYTTSDDIVLYSGTVTNTWDGTNSSLKAAIAGKLSKAGGTMTGAITTETSKWYTEGNYALHLNNSDMIGVNGIWFSDVSSDAGEGLMFLRSNGNWDDLYSVDGNLYYCTNRTTAGARSSAYTILHTGNGVLKDGGTYTGGNKTAGYCMHGVGTGHTYAVEWGSNLGFWVDVTKVATVSDRRLKDDIEPINMDLVKAIAECPSYQYKAFNRNGLISTGIIAQDLVENCKKYNVDPLKYELLDMEEFIDGDPTLYYHIEYDQLLYFKTLYLENKIKELEEKLCNLHKD